jgi:hypothetical protein
MSNDGDLFFDGALDDEDHDGSVTDDYMNAVRRRPTPLGRSYGGEDKIKLLNVRSKWLGDLDVHSSEPLSTGTEDMIFHARTDGST